MYIKRWMNYNITLCFTMYWITVLGSKYFVGLEENSSMLYNFQLIIVPLMWTIGIRTSLASCDKGELKKGAIMITLSYGLTLVILEIIRLVFIENSISELFNWMFTISLAYVAVIPFILIHYLQLWIWSNMEKIELKNIIRTGVVGVVSITLYFLVV